MSGHQRLERQHICSLLNAGRSTQDSRVIAMITLVLVFGLSRTAVSRLRWNDLDPISLTLQLRLRSQPLQISQLVGQQLLAIPKQSSMIFIKPGEGSLLLDALMAAALAAANLREFTWNDLASWSKAQSAQTRTAIATV